MFNSEEISIPEFRVHPGDVLTPNCRSKYRSV